jgi:hypothetical protein
VGGRRGSRGVSGVRILSFFGGLARSLRALLAQSESTSVAATLVSCAYGHLAANTPENRQLAYRLLAMAATTYRKSGRDREADETLTMLQQLKGSAPVEPVSVLRRDHNRDQRRPDRR